MVTKRQLGYLFITIGILVILGAIGANFIGGREAGFGPFQALGFGGGVVIIVLAIPLVKWEIVPLSNPKNEFIG